MPKSRRQISVPNNLFEITYFRYSEHVKKTWNEKKITHIKSVEYRERPIKEYFKNKDFEG